MSMNYFFAAFEQSAIDAMKEDHSLIDDYVFSNKSALLSTDVATAWDVLNHLLDGDGFEAVEFFDDALSNGGFFLSTDEVKEQANALSKWQPSAVLERFQNLDENADLYWINVYQDDPEDLLEEFDKLVDFYTKAAEQGLGAVHYAA